MPRWVEIVVPLCAGAAEDIGALLTDALADAIDEAAAGTLWRGDELVFWVPLSRGEAALRETRAAMAALAERGFAVAAADVRAEPAAPEAEWRDAWKRYFKVVRITRRIVIVPSWESYEPAGDDVVLDLDPGQAFGTGAHASTRLCLEELDALADTGMRVDRFLDIGTGSGILAIAAARLWPDASGTAIDSDPTAVAAARENLSRNQVIDRVACDTTPIADLDVAAAVAYLRRSCTAIFTVGFCFGGRHSWLSAAGGHGLAGAIGFYGRPGEAMDGPIGPTQRAHEFEAPILALMGGADEAITADDVAAFEEALDAAGVEHEVVTYDGAPHSFFDRRYEEFADASEDAWRRLLAFLERHGATG
jgi:ribosomal protein L11 methylase PrmA